ncbi:antibiotic biosynthesis monooxygenase [Arthrobacter crystallopoietes BAB-32]|uniref:Antibiotic biosynthesis monooxygenase n=1 Tax=Arthrobacter crystallopoietes BAB-32 TaxID=1246476 RepID=N1V2Z9_9MICC|nr:antibiotic biosynthesis monooxygenase family protein [Arthrobacter crystallopoietes]EMY35710.1 antibiotic biosynthesis monooxygenase [Arthrobacter crystallopoietes BAB-32]
MTVYTLGIWLVKPGREHDFVRAWEDLARRTKEAFPGGHALLMRDRDVPNRFISTGPWESVEQIEQWRGSSLFSEGLAGIRDTLEHFEPHTLEQVAVQE